MIGAEWAVGPGTEDGRLAAVAARMATAVARAAQRDAPAPTLDPAALAARIARLDPWPTAGIGVDAAIAEVERDVLPFAVHPWDPRAAAHLHAPTLLGCAVAELAIGTANQSLDSYDQAPAATLVEDHLVRSLARLLGLPDTASGVLSAGGTASNLLGLVLARARAHPGVGQDGLPPQAARWRIVTSAAAHDSVRRAAAILGLGATAVVGVAVDAAGALDVAALDAALDALDARDRRVIAIVATAGTTDLGAIDPLDAVADRARRCGAWLHVDGAVAAGFALSDALRPRLHGIARADSVTVDLHKLWWQPIGASALLVADARSFDALDHDSDYLNRPEDRAAGTVNLVSRSLDTSRRFDALKILLALRATGRETLAAMLEHLVALAAGAAAAIRERPALELLAEPSTVMVAFRVRAPAGHADALNTAVQRRLFAQGRAAIGRTRLHGEIALKLTLVNPRLTPADLEVLLDLVEAEAQTLRAP